jgi:hypothetical protein
MMESELPPFVRVPDTFSLVKRNHWVVMNEYDFARWEIEFPKGAMLDPRELWDYWKQVIQIGHEEAVFSITHMRMSKPTPDNEYGYVDISWESYVTRVEQLLAANDPVPLFGDIRRCDAAARLSHYDLSGNVVESNIGRNLSELLCALRPDAAERRGADGFQRFEDYLGFWRCPNPIDFRGKSARKWTREDIPSLSSEEFYEHGYELQAAYISICLPTDIWFPRVYGYMEDIERDEIFQEHEDGSYSLIKPGPYDFYQWFDNRELALVHTPRLNRFLQRVRQWTVECGGSWSIDRAACCDELLISDLLWNEDGIILDL